MAQLQRRAGGFGLCFFLVASLYGCSSVGSSPSNTVPVLRNFGDPTVLAHLDPTLQPAEFAAMYEVIAALPERARENVIFTDGDGNVHSNKQGLFAKSEPLTSGQIPELTPFVVPSLPPCNISTDVGGCTGVLYQHRGAIGKGYFSATVNVPCSSTLINAAGSGYQANIYVTISNAQALELGLQFNANLGKTVVSVQPYYSEGGMKNNGFTNNPHLTCDQTGVLFEAYVAQKTTSAQAYGVLYLYGAFNDIGGSSICGSLPTCSAALTTVNALSSIDQLTQKCGNCRISWTTGFAVPAGTNQILDGSTFALEGCSPQFNWGNVKVGSYSSVGPRAVATVAPWNSTVIAQSPVNAVNLGLVRLISPSLDTEFIGINENNSGCLAVGVH